MSGRLKNGVMIAVVAALIIIPLMFVRQPGPGPDGTKTELFKGSDDQAAAAIRKLAPAYQPWFSSLFTSPGPEIDSLLFALQAAIGAGFIGYYAGYSRGRAKQGKQTSETDRAH